MCPLFGGSTVIVKDKPSKSNSTLCIPLQPFGEATLGKVGLIVIPILVAFSTFGAANGGTFTSSRSIYGAAKDHLLPDFLSGLHTHYRTPVPAILFLVGALNV